MPTLVEIPSPAAPHRLGCAAQDDWRSAYRHTAARVERRSAGMSECWSVDQPFHRAGSGLQRVSLMPFLYLFPRTTVMARS